LFESEALLNGPGHSRRAPATCFTRMTTTTTVPYGTQPARMRMGLRTLVRPKLGESASGRRLSSPEESESSEPDAIQLAQDGRKRGRWTALID